MSTFYLGKAVSYHEGDRCWDGVVVYNGRSWSHPSQAADYRFKFDIELPPLELGEVLVRVDKVLAGAPCTTYHLWPLAKLVVR